MLIKAFLHVENFAEKVFLKLNKNSYCRKIQELKN